MSQAPAQAPSVTYPFSRIALAGATAIGLSIFANVLIRWLGMLLIDVPADLQPLASVQPILFFTVLFIAAATIAWAIITRMSKTPVRNWTLVAAIGFVVTLLPDFALVMLEQPTPMGTFSWDAAAILITMHIFSGVITWWVLPRFSRA